MNPARIFSSSSFIEAGSTIRWRVYERERKREATKRGFSASIVVLRRLVRRGRRIGQILECHFIYLHVQFRSLTTTATDATERPLFSRTWRFDRACKRALGVYIYYKRRRDDRERIASPWRSIENRGESIVEFWYHRFLTTRENNYLIYRANHSKKVERTEAMQFRRRINNMDN